MAYLFCSYNEHRRNKRKKMITTKKAIFILQIEEPEESPFFGGFWKTKTRLHLKLMLKSIKKNSIISSHGAEMWSLTEKLANNQQKTRKAHESIILEITLAGCKRNTSEKKRHRFSYSLK